MLGNLEINSGKWKKSNYTPSVIIQKFPFQPKTSFQ